MASTTLGLGLYEFLEEAELQQHFSGLETVLQVQKVNLSVSQWFYYYGCFLIHN